jgi:hypothetical protein
MFIQTVFVALLQIVLGLAFCFAGYRLFVVLLPIWGFFAGFLVTAQAVRELFGGGFLATTSSWVFGFVIGLLFAIAAYFFYVVAVALLAASLGYELGVGILSGFGVTSGVLLFLVGVILAVAVTAVVFLLDVPQLLIIVLTAAVGAGMILTGVLLALGRVSLTGLEWGTVGAFIRASWFWSLVFIVLAVVGTVAQMRTPEDYTLEPYSRTTARSPSSELPGPAV